MQPADTSAIEITSSRLIAEPRAVVFKAWIEPDQLTEWWGPKGFTSTFIEFDPRPGGIWRFVLHGPDGTDYKNESHFVEIVEPELIIFDHVSGPRFQVTATFDDEDTKTRLTFRMLFATVAECEKVKTYAVEADEQNFDRLETLIRKTVTAT